VATNGLDIGTVETGLKSALEAHARARTRGDFYENVFQVHTPLDDALDLLLGEQAQELGFSQKFELFLPDLFKACPVDQLNWQRNQLGHPRRQRDDKFVYETSVGLVDLAAAAWLGLFGHDTPPVVHPAFSAAAELSAPPPRPPAPTYQPVRPTPVMPTIPTPVAPAPRGRRLAPVYVALLMMVLILGAFLLGRQRAPVDPTRIAVGGKALVSVPAGKVILLNAAPGIGKTQVAHFADGAVLDVTAGPIISNNLTWWKVRGPNGEGWTVAEYLKPVGSR
jgi:hypothetical protein